MLGFLYIGRLEYEKGIDTIIDMVQRFGQDGKLPFALFIFGSGAYADQIKQLSRQYENVHFFGPQTHEIIRRYLPNIDYTLMPSRFLETFGLSAVESLAKGLPVIGPAKGGLEPFVFPELDLQQQEGDTLTDKLYNAVRYVVDNHAILEGKKLAEKSKKIATKYSIDKRIENINHILPNKKKKQTFLLVTDYTNIVGGIETYVWQTKVILEQQGHTVHIVGGKARGGKRGKVLRLLGIACTISNIYMTWKIHRAIKRHTPDIIWYHSLIRLIGRMGVWASRHSNAAKRMMYHDFGYIHPYPRYIEHINDIPHPLTYRQFINAGKTNHIIKKLMMTGKRQTVILLKKWLKKDIDKHLVPSRYMEKIIHQAYDIPKENIDTLPHFIQK